MLISTLLDADGRPSFNMLQNFGSASGPLYFFIFDLLMLSGRDVMAEPLVKRRDLIERRVLPKLAGAIRYSPAPEASLKDLISSVKAQSLEGLVAKRRDSKYEPGLRTGAWRKMCCALRLSKPTDRIGPMICEICGSRAIVSTRQRCRWFHCIRDR